MSYQDTTLKRLSVCPCGFPTLKTCVALGTPYRVDFDDTIHIDFYCGGCQTWHRDLIGVAVAPRGYMPLDLFKQPNDKHETIRPERN
jgi:hypothetical protein